MHKLCCSYFVVAFNHARNYDIFPLISLIAFRDFFDKTFLLQRISDWQQWKYAQKHLIGLKKGRKRKSFDYQFGKMRERKFPNCCCAIICPNFCAIESKSPHSVAGWAWADRELLIMSEQQPADQQRVQLRSHQKSPKGNFKTLFFVVLLTTTTPIANGIWIELVKPSSRGERTQQLRGTSMYVRACVFALLFYRFPASSSAPLFPALW